MLFRVRFISLVLVLPVAGLWAQNTPVIVQAESGPRGEEVTLSTGTTPQFVTAAATLPGTNPGSARRVISFSVTFPAAGTYELYARVRVGPNTFDDDSFYYGNGFGVKAPTSDDDWIMANGLSPVGYTAATDIVMGGGTAATEVWKWIKLSAFEGGESPIAFVVPAGALTQTFQIAVREDGLDLDQLAFGRSGVRFTVDNLDRGAAGDDTAVSFTPTGPPLATGKAKFLGSVHSASQVTNFTAYWNQVTPENAGKWGSVEAVRDVMNWTDLDAAYAFAKANGFPFRFHVLVWGGQQPTWIESLPAAEQLREIEQWFAAVAARYPAADYVEVVNEPINQPPAQAGKGNYIEALGGAGATGWDWVIKAFQLGRQYFPGKKLVLNEYSITNSTTNAQRYLAIINLLKARGLLDVVGVQGHAFETRVTAAVTATNLELLAAAGLPIMITELDIDGPTDQTQLDDYRRIFPVFWEHPAVIGITMWGYRAGMWRAANGATLVRDAGEEKPAMVWLKTYVRNNLPVIAVAQDYLVRSGAANGEVVGVVQASDADAGAALQTWQITGGTGAGLFAINAATGQITVSNATAINFAATAAYTLSVKVSDGIGTSAATTVFVSTPVSASVPRINPAPESTTVRLGGATVFSAAATGTAPLTYQWRKDGAPIVGATSASLAVANARVADAGTYTVVVTNPAGSTTSSATLAVSTAPNVARLINLAVRTRVGGEAGTPITGFVIGGTGAGKRIIVRAIGPTLGKFGLAGALADPQLQLWFDNGMVGSNDNWRATDAPAMSAVGAFPLDANSADAVVVSTLAPGAYTTPVAAPAGASGIVLIECYDGVTADAGVRLINASARAYVGTGDDVLIPGFVIDGEGTVRLLVRAVGPGLAAFGVSGTLVDPQLTLYQGDRVIGANDDWSAATNAAEVTAAAGAAGAFPLEPGSRDAALLVTLPAGAYTARVAGANNGTGVAIVEVYAVP